MSEVAKEVIRILTDRPDLTEQILTIVIEEAIEAGIPLETCKQILES